MMDTIATDSNARAATPSRPENFVRNVLLTASSRLLTLFASLGISVISARSLGPRDRGVYFFVITLAAVLAQFTNLGLHSSNTYYSAEDPSRTGDLATNSAWLSTFLGAAVSILVILLVPWGRATPGIWYAVVLVPANLFFLFGGSLLLGSHRTSAFNVLQIFAYLVLLALVTLAAWLRLSVAGFLGLTSLAWSLSAIAAFGLLLPQIRTWRFRSGVFLQGLRYSAKAYATCLLGLLVLRANVFLLKYMQGSESVGYFSVAAQIGDALGAFPIVVSMLLFPRLVRDRENSWSITKNNLRNVGALMLVGCIAAALVSKPFVLIFYGAAYVKAIPILLWMLPGVFFLALTVIISQYLSAQGFPIGQVVAWVLGLALILGLASVLIGARGVAGAALALSIDYALIFFMLSLVAARMCRRELKTADILSAYPLSPRLGEETLNKWSGCISLFQWSREK